MVKKIIKTCLWFQKDQKLYKFITTFSCNKYLIYFFCFDIKKYIVIKKGESMTRKLLIIIAIGMTTSGCFMAPMALIGPATSGFSTASLIQSGVTSGASYVVKKSTGKSITEHVLSEITKDVLQQAYVPENYKKKSTSLNK